MTVWHKVDGFEKKKLEGKLLGYFIDGQRVSETTFKRRYVRALEAELDAAHAKLAKIFDIL